MHVPLATIFIMAGLMLVLGATQLHTTGLQHSHKNTTEQAMLLKLSCESIQSCPTGLTFLSIPTSPFLCLASAFALAFAFSDPQPANPLPTLTKSNVSTHACMWSRD